MRLEAHFEFHTEGPRATVKLGCQKAWPIAAKMDGKIPWLRQTDDGLVLNVDTAGKHEADIELLAPVVSRRGPRGTERGLDLDLPGAAITRLERLELPVGVAEARAREAGSSSRAGWKIESNCSKTFCWGPGRSITSI